MQSRKCDPIQRHIPSLGSTPLSGITYNASIICSTNFTYHTNIDCSIDTFYLRRKKRKFKERVDLEFCVLIVTLQEEYRSEGISLERISFTDNRPVLDMFLQVIC